MITEDKKNEFGILIDSAISSLGLKKKHIAREAGIHPTSLSRIISGEIGVARETALDIVKAINKLANREVLNENEALLVALKAPQQSQKAFIKPILEAMNKAENLTENDSILISNFILMLNQQRLEEKNK